MVASAPAPAGLVGVAAAVPPSASTNLPTPTSSPPPIPAATPLPTGTTPPPSSPLQSPPPATPPRQSSPVPPTIVSSPAPASPSPPPPSTSSPAPPVPMTSPPPPVKPSSPPPVISPPTTPSPPPPSATPSPPPPSATPPLSPPPPPTTLPPKSAPPPPPSAKPPAASPPPPTAKPPSSPATPPPPPATPAPTPATPSPNPPVSSPSPPSPPASNTPTDTPPPPPPHQVPISPQASPPPPASKPPNKSPPPPLSNPPTNSPPVISPPPPPRLTPSPPGSPPTTSPINPPPTPTSLSAPPPPVLSPPTSSTPSTPASTSPSGSGSDPNTTANANSTGHTGSGMGTVVAVVIGVAVSIILLSLIGFAAWCAKKRRKKATGLNGVYIVPSPLSSSPTSDSLILKTHSSAPLVASSSGSDVVFSPREPGGIGNSKPWFTYEELVMATNGFAHENLLGEGGFGYVYKGCLPDGRQIAVKQLKIGSGQGDREFKAEVEIISRIHHRHLVSLVGYCIAESRRLLVYDFVPNNTLYFHLHGKDRPILDWATRVKIAAGAARGLAYLHEDCHPRIIHRDIKSSNILLDDNFEARVSDFGLAKLALDANTHVTTRVMGTFGYMAPEYASSGKLTEKSDVFSFGVVLLELITGRKPVDPSQPLGDESLVEWARPLLSHALENGEFKGLVDLRLEKNYVDAELFQMIEAAAACVRHSATKRPRMGQVVRAFDTLATSDLTNGMRLGESEVFNSAVQDEEIRLFQRMAFGSREYSTEFFSRCSSNV